MARFGSIKRGQRLRSFRGQHMRKPRCVVCIGQKPIARVIGQFCRLRLDMRARRTEGIKRGKIKLRQNVQQQNRRCPLAIWRMLQQFGAFVGAS